MSAKNKEDIEENNKTPIDPKDLEKERLKHLFPEKKRDTMPKPEYDGWRKHFEEAKNNGMLDKAVWAGVTLIACIGIGLFFYSKKLTEESENQKVTMARQIADFVITEQSGPKPFVVSIKDPRTNEEFEHIKIANDCVLFDRKSYVGETMKLIKFTMVNVNDENDKSYYFKGVEERICDGRSFIPDSSNAFHIE